jgi:hypothetical protein
VSFIESGVACETVEKKIFDTEYESLQATKTPFRLPEQIANINPTTPVHSFSDQNIQKGFSFNTV